MIFYRRVGVYFGTFAGLWPCVCEAETTATVEDHRQVRVAGEPFAAGTEVEVSISPKRRPADEFTVAWQRVCAEWRGRPDLKDIHR